ncbi:C4-dicarboxylate ABC transporter permease [Hydrogenovibrio sp. SC-1]|uniref:TRAP transporter small permease subunit n=1 Tax=Hydrogenovibrio sp. SC-1 TaxID=2065820 RepID=UPI000C79FFAB|nr:TRAP transporter small permease subunit [Hydrogenovibrio sp. SC-1]PLA74569.1 C4-dicarboxylate ABC transporter permease [Hydrogenovibrio sp. SC-1]
MQSQRQPSNSLSTADYLLKFVILQNQFQQGIGKAFAWLALLLVVLSASIVILRYGFESGSIALQESILYTHAIFFMMGMGYTLQQDAHVRVDVFYSRFTPRNQAIIDLMGSLVFALPALIFILWIGWDYVSDSWAIQESSAEAGGLPYLYLLKSFMIIMALLMVLQVLSVIAQTSCQLLYPQDPKLIRFLAENRPQHEEKF